MEHERSRTNVSRDLKAALDRAQRAVTAEEEAEARDPVDTRNSAHAAQLRVYLKGAHALPGFILFVYKKFVDPEFTKSFPDVERRYTEAVKLYSGEKTFRSMLQAKLAVLQLAAEAH